MHRVAIFNSSYKVICFYIFLDFRDLFPAQNFYTGKMTVITLSQKTKNDMSMWSPDVEDEREALLEQVSQWIPEYVPSYE